MTGRGRNWFAGYDAPGTGIDFTLDLTSAGVENVGAYVSFHDASAADHEGFCASIGRARDVERCRRLADSFPQGWRVWYASPFPGRAGSPVRAAGLASEQLKRALSHDRSLVREHFGSMGLSPVPDELCAWLALFCSPTCFMMPWQDGEPLGAKAYPKLVGHLMGQRA